MSGSIDAYSEHAQLSMAVYATLTEGMPNDAFRNALKNEGFSDIQATTFVNTYSIVKVFNDPSTSFSATLFQKRGSTEKILAIRGTESWQDIVISDLQIGLFGLTNQYQSLRNFLPQILSQIQLGETLTVTGHSLGGFLAQVFTLENQGLVSHAFTTNTPGLGGMLFNPLGSFGVAGEIVPYSAITNLIAHGHSFVASQGRQFGTPHSVFIEQSLNPLDNHGKMSITDALALYGAFALVDPKLNTWQVTNILEAVSQINQRTLESALDALRRTFRGSDILPTPISSPLAENSSSEARNTYYSNLVSFQSSITSGSSGLHRIVSLVGQPENDIFSQAKSQTLDGLAYRYALRELNPFIVTGINYLARHNADHSLDLYDPKAGVGVWTQVALNDRAELLAEKLRFNQADGLPTSPTLFVDEKTVFDNQRGAAASESVIFGDGEGREYFGRRGSDHIYGGGGDDFVHGAGGQDYLEGNDGTDELYGEEDNDILLGQEGNDRLDGGTGADRMSGGTGDDIYIVDSSSDRVIELTNQGIDEVRTSITFTLSSEVEKLTLTGNAAIDGTGNELGNLVVGNDKANTLWGLGGKDHLIGGGGTDTLEGGTGDDILEGGAGEDIYRYFSGDGVDRIEDAQGTNRIFVDGQLLLPGLRPAGGSGGVYTSLDGQFVYTQSGGDLLVSRPGGDTLLILNENFQSGQFGIILQDEPSYANNLSTKTNDDYTVAGTPPQSALNEQSNRLILDAGVNNVIHGLGGNDELFAGIGNDSLYGDAGEDRLQGETGWDRLYGGEGSDLLFGQSGDDHLEGGVGDDQLLGGYGVDVLRGGDGNDLMMGDLGTDLDDPLPFDPTGGAGDLLEGGAGNDKMEGESGDDTLTGGGGDDEVWGDFGLFNPQTPEGITTGLLQQGGQDSLDGGEGNDVLIGGAGDDILAGGAGNDRLDGDLPVDVNALPGFARQTVGGNDVLDGGDGGDFLQGGVGDDLLYGGQGADTLYGEDSMGLSSPGDDYLDGGDGEDLLAGGGGDDILAGGTGNDQLYGGNRFDVLDGGSDTLFGEEGEDRLYGAMGEDLLDGGTGNDVLMGDDLVLSNGAFIVAAAPGNDQLDGGDGDDRLYAGGGDDVLTGGAGGDVLFGDDYVEGIVEQYSSGHDILDGGDGDDQLVGGTGDDQLFGDTGNDQLIGDRIGRAEFLNEGGDDFLDGGEGDDRLDGGLGDDILVGGEGNDFLAGGAGNDQLDGGAGDDVLVGGDGIDVFLGGDGHDQLTGTGTLDGGAGNDRLEGGSGNDTYRFDVGYGQDVLAGLGGGLDTVEFGSAIMPVALSLQRTAGAQLQGDGPDLLVTLAGGTDALLIQNYFADTPSGTVEFRFADGMVWSQDQIKDHLLVSAGQTNLVQGFNDRSDKLQGTAQSQVLAGLAGNDTLSGGGGQDLLLGGSGNDAYLFGVGSGHVTAFDRTGAQDTIRLQPGLTPNDITVLRSGQNLILSLNATGEDLTMPLFFASGAAQIEQVQFSDGTVWDGTTVARLAQGVVGTNDADSLQGTAVNDALYGLAGNDTLDGGTGADSLVGGLGDDTSIVDDAGDVVTELANEGTDTVRSSVTYSLPQNVEHLTLTGAAAINGTGNALDNIFIGNSAANVLTGGKGNDTYVIGAGDTVVEQANEGIDTVVTDETYTLGANAENLLLAGAAAIDGTGNELDNILTGNSAANLLTGGAGNDIYVVGAGDTVVEQADEGIDTVVTDQTYRLGANVENLTLTGIANLNATGNDLDNVLVGNSAANVVIGGAGNDTYVIGVGDTVVEQVNEGIDTVVTEQSYALEANVENLTLVGSASLNGTGNELDNRLVGNDGENRLEGGLGADQLLGGKGNDTYVVGAGDTVVEQANEGIDTVVSDQTYALGANVENLTLAGTGAIDGTGNNLDNILTGNTAANVFIGGLGNDTYVIGAGDTVVEQADEGIDTVVTDRSYTLGADVENLTLTGTADIEATGNDLENVLTGNSGANILTGGLGSDTYRFGWGSGQDVIIEHDATSTSFDTVEFGDNLTQQDLTVSRNGDDLVLSIKGTRDRLTLQSFFAGSAKQVEYFTFANGQFWDVAAVLDQLPKTLTGTTGQDALYGGGGADLLDGGADDDKLYGYDGNDTYRFGIGSGRDTILDFDPTVGNLDTIELGTGITPGNLLVTRTGDDLILHVTGTSDQLTVQSFLTDPAYRIEQVRFADGTTWDSETLRNQARQLLIGTGGNDFLQPVNVVGGPVDHLLSGGTGDDILNSDTDDDVLFIGRDKLVGGDDNDRLMGGALDDVLEGGAGDDRLYGDAYFSSFAPGNAQSSIHPGADDLLGGVGNDFLDGGGGNDRLDGGTGTDILFGQDGDDQLEGGEGQDTLVGGTGKDVLVGGQGNDALYGDDQANAVQGGDDVLDGGAGEDILSGGAGSDTYRFGRGYGQDTINNFDTGFGRQDVIRLSTDVLPSDVIVTRGVDPSRAELGQADLILAIAGTQDQVTVRGFFAAEPNQIQQVIFGDGTIWDVSTLISKAETLKGTAGADVLKGTGLIVNETLIGLDGNDVLDGGAGVDLLIGGTGDDTYVVDTTLDQIVERSGEGTDTVRSLVNYTLADGLENLTLLNPAGNNVNLGNGQFGPDPERAATFGIGNAENNVLTGNQADNILDGGAGDDTLFGGDGSTRTPVNGGNDILIGGAGDDTFWYNPRGGMDTIVDVAVAGEGNMLIFGSNGRERITDSAVTLDVFAGQLRLVTATDSNGDVRDAVLLSSFNPYDPFGPHAVDTFQFANGATLSYDALLARGFDFRGTQANDAMLGTVLDDRMTGRAGNDELRGSAGNDTYVFELGDGQDTIEDVATAQAGNAIELGFGIGLKDLQIVQSGFTLTIGVGTGWDAIALHGFDPSGLNGSLVIEQLRFDDGSRVALSDLFVTPATDGHDVLVGGVSDDLLFARGGDDTLNGGVGTDLLMGGAGNDTYLFGAGDGIDTITDVAGPGEGNRLVLGAGFDAATARFERVATERSELALTAGMDQIRLTHFDAQNPFGAHAVDTFQFADGAILTYQTLLSRGLDIRGSETDADVLQGVDGTNDRLIGLGWDDALIGGTGDDALIGGHGNDSLEGGAGSDTYVFNLGDGVDVLRDQGASGEVNRLVFGSGITLADLRLVTNPFDYRLLIGTNGDAIRFVNLPFGVEDVQRIEFADGISTTLKDLLPAIVGTADDDVALTGRATSDVISGLAGNDVIRGGDGDDTIIGGYGNDTIQGDAGFDIYVFNLGDGVDSIVESAGLGDANRIQFGAGITVNDVTVMEQEGLWTITVGNGGDEIFVSGSSAPADFFQFADGTQRSIAAWARSGPATGLRDVLAGGSGDDTLDGLAGDDVLYGGVGDDLLLGGEGTDYLLGGAGQDALNGGRGIDTLEGGAGDDLYLVDDLLDVVIERRGEGIDTIQSTIGYRLRDDGNSDVENLTLVGTLAVSGVGNGLDNVLTGNALNNRLDGGVGADRLIGGVGDDIYGVDDLRDMVVERENEGVDTIESSVDMVLSANVENLTLTHSALTGTGNTLNNILMGNDLDNLLDGGAGADVLDGGAGSDTYIVDDLGDVVTEQAYGGVDLIHSSVTFTLGEQIENLTLAGGAAIDGTGNELANRLIGNAAANVLSGDAGNDTLSGEAGNDTLKGGTGSDIYLFNLGDGIDTIDDTATSGEGNRILFGVGITQSDLRFDKAGSVLTIHVKNGGDAIRLLNFAPTGINGSVVVETVAFADGTFARLADFQVGSAEITGTEGGDTLTGTPDDDVINALGDNDTVEALAGNDTVSGGTGNDHLKGGAGGDVLLGEAGDDLLDGETGADRLAGGVGNDTYILDQSDDVVTELADEGIDTVQSALTHALSPNVENLTLIGADAINGTGNDLDNVLTGNSAANILAGALGNDTYVVGAGDTVVENSNEGIDMVESSMSWVLGNHVENLVLTGSAAINGTGNGSNNALIGNSADNILDGGSGADTLWGGAGDDVYVVDNAGDVVVELANQGTDRVQTSVSYTLGVNVENLTLIGTAAINGMGNELGNILTGNGAENVLDGGAGSDAMSGGQGDDAYLIDDIGDRVTEQVNEGEDLVVSSVSYTLEEHVENLRLVGMDNLTGTGNAQANMLTGNTGSNMLDGALGADTLIGLAGDDTYQIEDLGDVVIEQENEGFDIVRSSVSYTLGGNIESLTLTGTGNLNGTGNHLNNVLTGNAADNRLDGGTGGDTMAGGLGNDTYVIDQSGDVIIEQANEGTDIVESAVTYSLGANLENLTLIGVSVINGAGNALDNLLLGNSAANALDGGPGNDRLDGGQGSDLMIGGTGDDTYVVDNLGDVVTELTNEGTDTIQSGVSYTLGINVENLTLTGSANLAGIGNSLNNLLIGNWGNNILDGGAGADTMTGGIGDDTYLVDNVGDVVNEATDEGVDAIQSSITHVLGANLENLTLMGTAAINGGGNDRNNILTGNGAANVLDGGAGNDTLLGGAGNDTLRGGVGDDRLEGGTGGDVLIGGSGGDTYVVDSISDTLTELLNEGADTVESTVTFMLGANFENLTLVGSGAINGTGNALDNILLGNGANNTLRGGAGDDRLDGGSGSDTMVGGTGNDTYVINQVGDVVTESANEGMDTVESAITYFLGSNVENLILIGSAANNGTGNSLNNVIKGNSAANLLDGGSGDDALEGGAGNDAISGGSGRDVMNGGEGADTLDGGSGDDQLRGGAGNDILTGGSGADQLIGEMGNDFLRGGSGNDRYFFVRSDGQDTIVESDPSLFNQDTVQFGASIDPLDLVLSRQANDLRLSVYGSSDQVTIKDWYLGSAYQTEMIQAGNGQQLQSTQVNQLIQAMAGFTQQTGLSWDQAIAQRPQEVQAILAANWH